MSNNIYSILSNENIPIENSYQISKNNYDEKINETEFFKQINLLPDDILYHIHNIHHQKYLSHKKYVIEFNINLDMVVNWQGASYWHNDDPGDDEFYGSIFPLVQVIYDAGTNTWHKPGYLVKTPLPVNEDYMPIGKSYTKEYVGFNKLRLKTIDRWMENVLNKYSTKNLLNALDRHKKEGDYRTYRKYISHDYTVTWYSYYSSVIRIREIIPSSVYKKVTNKTLTEWPYLTPGSYDDIKDFNPYPFETKHVCLKYVDVKTIDEVWEELKQCLYKENFN